MGNYDITLDVVQDGFIERSHIVQLNSTLTAQMLV